ncbi:MAG: Iron-sulfur flavoprotein [Candidatus Ozemobacter sibiricus]|uniref:Iron-sulfur flavoprotein n=1 Tax=Candidatus Ozemobacter sibiricus TaxID=2268124 RepID=A0A367ZTB0_9BACT|nr:MAG: Iron-sulfur flavoprotein [Candidatus Ozemobacter sibiricus]
MNIVVFNGSPRKNGGCAALIQALVAGAQKKGHTAKVFHLIDQRVEPCLACYACMGRKVEFCVHDDDFTPMARDLLAADTVVFASPVYMGQITGLLKTFFDRWITFAEPDFSIRHVKGKRFVTIVTSGAPADRFKEVTDYLKYWLGEFFKMRHAGSLMAGDLHDPGDVQKRPDLLREAEALGQAL